MTLLDNPNIICAFSSRFFNNMSLFYGDTSNSLINRKIFLERLGIDYQDLVCAKQAHADNIRYVEEKDRGRGALSYDKAIADTDAFITDKKILPLAIFTADCLSIFLYAPLIPAIGLVHAGWRSTKEKITVKTVQLIQERFRIKANNLYVGFGPCIRTCCYEVGEEFDSLFSDGLIRRDNNYYLDLVTINKNQLLSLGVKEENISDSGICTSCRNNEFYSYRREKYSCGRTMSVIMLKGKSS